MVSTWQKIAAAALGSVLLAGCVGIKDHRGFVIDKEVASAIQPGVDNKDSVLKSLGRPSFVGQFDQNDWYYLSRDTTSRAFGGPHVDDQTLLHIRFDAGGNVASVGRSGREMIASIRPVRDKTPTLGRKHSFFDELFGNMGVFNSGALGQSGSQGQ